MRCFIFAIAFIAAAQCVLGAGESTSKKLTRRALVDIGILNRGRRPCNTGNSLIEVDILNSYLKNASKAAKNAQ
uniref:Secreted protein n=1 Tax=Phakopsora pachyrhizi TaxID=170000 RepID=A0A0S1MK83_PHAPC